MNAHKAEILVLGSVAFAAIGQTLIKLGLMRHGFWTAAVALGHLSVPGGVVLGLLVYGLGTLLWFAAVARQSISYLYPLAATNYILMGLVGHFLLHEQMRTLRWCGIFVMAGGIALLSTTSDRAAA